MPGGNDRVVATVFAGNEINEISERAGNTRIVMQTEMEVVVGCRKRAG